jgi:hypothetical protein
MKNLSKRCVPELLTQTRMPMNWKIRDYNNPITALNIQFYVEALCDFNQIKAVLMKRHGLIYIKAPLPVLKALILGKN